MTAISTGTTTSGARRVDRSPHPATATRTLSTLKKARTRPSFHDSIHVQDLCWLAEQLFSKLASIVSQSALLLRVARTQSKNLLVRYEDWSPVATLDALRHGSCWRRSPWVPFDKGILLKKFRNRFRRYLLQAQDLGDLKLQSPRAFVDSRKQWSQECVNTIANKHTPLVRLSSAPPCSTSLLFGAGILLDLHQPYPSDPVITWIVDCPGQR